MQGGHPYTQIPHFTGSLHLITQALLLWLPVRSVKGFGRCFAERFFFPKLFYALSCRYENLLADVSVDFFSGVIVSKNQSSKCTGSHGLKSLALAIHVWVFLKNTFFFPSFCFFLECIPVWRGKKGEKGDCLSVATGATSALWWGQWQEKAPCLWAPCRPSGRMLHCSRWFIHK